MIVLPSKSEYQEIEAKAEINASKWSAPLYKCPECGGPVRKNLSFALMVYPPMWKYKCDDCGYEEVW